MARALKTLIKGGRVFDGESFLFADVLTEGSLISKIEPDVSDPADFVYDARGKTVAPGLIDIHLHIRGISSDEYGIQGEAGCFPFGVTAAADASGRYGDKALLESFMLKSVVFPAIKITSNRADFSETEVALSRFQDKAVGIKVYFDSGNSELLDTAPLLEACEFARKRNLRVMVHCTNSPSPMKEVADALIAGDILTHPFHGGVNNASVDGFECLFSAQKRGVVIDSGFAGHIHTDFAVFRAAIAKGFVPDTISTDLTRLSAYKRGGRYGMTTCMTMARIAGLSEEQIFRCTTKNAALALGKEDTLGSLKVGGHADIAVFDYTDEGFDFTDRAKNRMNSDKGYRCALTLADGEVVYRD